MASAPKKEKVRLIAEESFKTLKARQKLKKQLEALDKKITPQAIERKTIEIHRWIARHAAPTGALAHQRRSLLMRTKMPQNSVSALSFWPSK